MIPGYVKGLAMLLTVGPNLGHRRSDPLAKIFLVKISKIAGMNAASSNSCRTALKFMSAIFWHNP